jgi:hypothetical protein
MCRSIELLLVKRTVIEDWSWEIDFFGGVIERVNALVGSGGAIEVSFR